MRLDRLKHGAGLTSQAPTTRGAPVRLAATAQAVRQMLCDLRGHWPHLEQSDDLWATTELVLAEVLNNIVEHAMAGRGDGCIEIDMVAGATGPVFTLRDDGRPMPGGELPQGDPPQIGPDLDDLPEGGFGWHLIRCLTLDLRYERADGWNCLHFGIGTGDALDGES